MNPHPGKDGNIKFTVHGRAAAHPRYRDGKKIDLGQSPNHSPLTVGSGQGEREVYTLHFTLDIKIPLAALNPTKTPKFNITIPDEALRGIAPEAEIVAVLIEEP